MAIPVSVFTPSISVCPTANCNKINIFDVSGIYGQTCSNHLNLTGYGLPNIDISTITSAILNISQVVDANMTLQPSHLLNVYIFNSVPPVNPTDPPLVAGVMPNTSGIPYIANLADFGFSGVPIVFITLAYSDGTTTWTAEFYYVNLCSFYCCLKKKQDHGCGCKDGDGAAEVERLLHSIEDLKCCAVNLQGIFDIWKKLSKLCAPCGC